MSTVYLNAITKLRWQCGSGHQFEASPNSVKSGHWCPQCAREKAGDSQRLGMTFFNDLAEERGGSCLSTNYKSIKSVLKWRCSQGHEWESRADVVKNGGWCSKCGGFTHEELVRSILETSLMKKFPKARPSWLVNSRGNRMELDGFCEELRLAFEYQGIQHYKESHHFHKRSSFHQRVADDLVKKQACEKHGVTLLAVHYSIPASDLPAFLQKECARLGLGSGDQFTWNERDIYERKSDEVLRLRNIARSKGGDLVSSVFLTSSSPLLWRCKSGHQWEATSNVIVQGHWCPKCAAEETRLRNTLDIDVFIKLAESMGGVCLSHDRVKGVGKLRFRCANGHEWSTHQYLVRQGRWCPKCAKAGPASRYTIYDAEALALKNGGACLSKTLTSSQESLAWRCRDGHLFKGPIRSVRRSWCPRCLKEKAFLSACSEVASSHGGLCLSTRFINAKTKMRWKCKVGHQWETSWSSVKSGRWCPECGRANQWVKRRTEGG